MKRLFPVYVLVLGLFSSTGWSLPSSGLTLRDNVAQFLQSNVMDRTQLLATEGTMKSGDQVYQVKFNALVTWSGLRLTEEGLVFQQSRQIQQSSVPIDANGKPTGPVLNTDRVVVMQYGLTERQTSKSLVGLAVMTKNTQEDPTGVGSVAMIELSDDGKELYLYESQAGFREGSLDGINLVPMSSASEMTLFVDAKGKLQMNDTMKFYKVDLNRDFVREEIERFNLSATEVTQ